jgi:hypothetical protein
MKIDPRRMRFLHHHEPQSEIIVLPADDSHEEEEAIDGIASRIKKHFNHSIHTSETTKLLICNKQLRERGFRGEAC